MVPGNYMHLHLRVAPGTNCGGGEATGGRTWMFLLQFGQRQKKTGVDLLRLLISLFLFQETFEPVTEKGTCHEDDYIDNDDDENIKYSQEARAKT